MFRLLRGGVPAGLVAIALALNACSGDDAEDTQPRGPENFSIAQVGTASNVVVTSGADLKVTCAEPLMVWVAPGTTSTIVTTQDAEGKVLPSTWSPPGESKSRFELGDFKLAPPNDCGGEIDCGWIELQVTPPAEAVSAESASDEQYQYLAAHSVIRVDIPKAFWTAGLWTFRIQLLDSTGTPVLSKQTNEPLTDEFTVNVAQIGTCAEPAN